MRTPHLSPPTPEDAAGWFDFLIAQQAAAYAGIVPDDFARRQSGYREEWVPELAAAFDEPGTARRLVAKVDGRIVGAASIADAPAAWEVELGLVPSPTGRALERLYVDAAHHGTGLAQALFDGVDDGREVYLWLIDGNERGRRFYLRRGFIDLDETFPTGPSWGNVPMHRMARRR